MVFAMVFSCHFLFRRRPGARRRRCGPRISGPDRSWRERWYVIHVYSGFEKKVAQSIREQADNKGLGERFEEMLVPTEEVIEVKRGAKVSAERKFFPGYVLVKMDLTDETWHLVKNTPKVTGFLGGKGRPMPISEAEAGRIMRQVQEGIERPKPSITFEIGEQVRVIGRAVHLVQRLCRGSRRGEIAPQGRGLDLRPRDPGRARIFAGGEGLASDCQYRAARVGGRTRGEQIVLAGGTPKPHRATPKRKRT